MTIISLFENSDSKYPNNPFLWEKTTGPYQPLTYSKTYDRVRQFANGLLSLGILPYDKVILLSEGRSDWVIAELSVLFVAAVCVPVSVKIEESDELKFRVVHSEARFIIVSDRNLPKIRLLLPQLHAVEKIIVLDDDFEPADKLVSATQMIAEGHAFEKLNPDTFIDRKNSVNPGDIANICYTSGTTADPKGIMLSHSNYCSNAEQSGLLFDVPPWYISLMILPWDHSFAHTVGIYTLMKNGASLASVQQGKTPLDTIKNLSSNIQEIKPVFLLSVPALAKNFKNNIEKGISEKGTFVNALFRIALKTSYFYKANGFDKGKGLRWIAGPFHAMFNAILYKKIRANFGGRLRFFVGGGALLDIEFQRFFNAIGIPMFQGYGLTEASPVISSNTPDFHKLGTSGKPVQYMELKICDENGNALPQGQKGEIVIKGGNIMAGYWKNEKATAETLRDGWLFTGDLGYLDADGFLTVMGRFKSLLISSDGEKFSPEAIEEALELHSPYIRQAMLINDQQNYTSAIIVPDFAAIRSHLAHKTTHATPEEYAHQAVLLIKQSIAQFNQGGHYHNMFPKRWIPSTFALVAEEFTEQNHMINSTMKIVRSKIIQTYRKRIEYIYTAEGKEVLNAGNLEVFMKNINNPS
jgi:long-chain acyl-CoA synthetase